MSGLPPHVLLFVIFYAASNALVFLATVWFARRWGADEHATMIRAFLVAAAAAALQLPASIAIALESGDRSDQLLFVIVGSMVGFVVLSLELTQSQFMSKSMPLLFGGPRRFAGVVLGAFVGLLAAAVSIPIFNALGPEVLREPELASASGAPVWFLYALGASVAATALSEEVVFRGLMQPWIRQALGGGRAEAVVGIVLSSLLWSFGHAAYTDPAWIKMLQIFVIGCAFGVLAERINLQSAIAAHVALNLFSLGPAFSS